MAVEEEEEGRGRELVALERGEDRIRLTTHSKTEEVCKCQ